MEKDKCHSEKCNWLCPKKCPVNLDEVECISKDNEKAGIDEKLCVGCGICQRICPFHAIQIVNLPSELKEEPIHRFGKNSFRLYRLALPKKGIVTGILGRNGIGKSTALGILAGQFIPNLGDYKTKELNYDNLIEKNSNNILGEYFRNLKNRKIKISYKPQRVELLTKLYNESVNVLLKKIDERNISDVLIDEFNMDNVLKRKLNELSGGELQKVAIIATLVKNADVYYFDEPMTFLDVVTRIKAAKMIKEYTKEKACLVVEHDLTSLDYISDEVQIVYGEAGAYGVFSNGKSVSKGINDYLEGYLLEENVRFRDYSIKYSKVAMTKDVQRETVFEFPEIKKKYPGFDLDVKSGKLHKGEVLAIMGANGLGKSTFLKILAGIEKADNVKLNRINFSYKEQVLMQDSELSVEEFFNEHKVEMSSGWYKQNILDKLGIGRILLNKMNELSGGELQKVHIALALSKKVDLILLDEPSAFIDVEDRLKVAEIIKEFTVKKEVSTIVVDHDVQFIDYLADSLLVFSGESGKHGHVEKALDKKDGMNQVLKLLDITYRIDKTSGRRRINKPDSVLDREQRKKGEYYYI